MTAAITKAADAQIFVGDDLTAAGYSEKEISLLGYVWQDAKAINTTKTSLAKHLWELKQEMDGKRWPTPADAGAKAVDLPLLGCI